MKWIILLSLGHFLACAQTPETENKSAGKHPEIFNSRYVRLMPDTSKMMLIENVIIHYDNLHVEADSALLEKSIRTVTAFGIKKVIFNGEKIDKKLYKNMIRYKKGDSRFYTD